MTEDHQKISKNLINDFATILKDIEIEEENINEYAKKIIDLSKQNNQPISDNDNNKNI